MRGFAKFVLIASLLASPSRAEDLPQLQTRGRLQVLTVDGSPAFLTLKAGPPGLDREILDGFGHLNRLRVEVVEVSTWDGLVPALLAGKGDLIAGGVTASESRAKQVDFTAEVFPTRNVVLTYKPQRVVRSVEELRSERVGTIKGTTLAEVVAAANVPARNVDDSLPSDGILEALRTGKVTASVDGIEDAMLLGKVDPNVQIGTFLGPPASLAFGVRKDAPQLRAALDEYLTNLRHTTTWNRLVVKYFGESSLQLLKDVRTP